MGRALIDRASGRVLAWQRWGEPAHDAQTQAVIPCDEPPDRAAVRWDGDTGLRPATAQEIADDEAARAAALPERKAIRDAAADAIADNAAFLALSSPTNAQVLAQVRRLTQQNNAIIRRLIQID